MYTMVHFDFTATNIMGNSIGIQRVKASAKKVRGLEVYSGPLKPNKAAFNQYIGLLEQ